MTLHAPRPLNGRLLLGLAVIATPWVAVLVTCVLQLRQLADASERLLLWAIALLVPLTALALLFVSIRLGRPLRRQLLGITEERNRFLRHMSHELKTPLANIREGTELLMDGAVGGLAPEQREVMGILRENSLNLQRLIENLLSYSAWQSSKVGLDLSTFRLRALMRQVIESQQLSLLGRRVNLDAQIEDCELVADRAKLRLILDNLLSNAIKYSPAGGHVLLRAAVEDRELVLDVADSGPGIPPGDRAHVFEAFFTGQAPQGHVRGTGIGLSVVLEFVTLHGGSIGIIDGEWSGAHFRIRLPRRTEPTRP